MIICPYCDAENIEGADHCDRCGHALADLHLPSPATAVEKSLLRDRVRILGPKPPIMVTPSTSISFVLQAMVEMEIGCVLVVDPDDRSQMVGVFTERDALLRLDPDSDLSTRSIGEVMTPNPHGLPETAKVAFALRTMDQGGYRHVPVLDDAGRVNGMISVRDILRYLTDRMARV